jgi:hypothetical protein
LFFVANLATFTTYHSITDSKYLITYIGFFGILWSCWFQVTLHDVRFARDSIYERVCKTIQFVVFVGLALVGSNFNPGGVKGNNTVSDFGWDVKGMPLMFSELSYPLLHIGHQQRTLGYSIRRHLRMCLI